MSDISGRARIATDADILRQAARVCETMHSLNREEGYTGSMQLALHMRAVLLEWADLLEHRSKAKP